jgi:hypothetical protein
VTIPFSCSLCKHVKLLLTRGKLLKANRLCHILQLFCGIVLDGVYPSRSMHKKYLRGQEMDKVMSLEQTYVFLSYVMFAYIC